MPPRIFIFLTLLSQSRCPLTVQVIASPAQRIVSLAKTYEIWMDNYIGQHRCCSESKEHVGTRILNRLSVLLINQLDLPTPLQP